jgi:hypothetical protein
MKKLFAGNKSVHNVRRLLAWCKTSREVYCVSRREGRQFVIARRLFIWCPNRMPMMKMMYFMPGAIKSHAQFLTPITYRCYDLKSYISWRRTLDRRTTILAVW